MLCGVFSTFLIPETKRKTLEELSGEDDYAANPSAHVTVSSGVMETKNVDANESV